MLMDRLFSQAEVETRVEIHHCRYHEYKNYLKEGEEQIGDLLGPIENALAVIK